MNLSNVEARLEAILALLEPVNYSPVQFDSELREAVTSSSFDDFQRVYGKAVEVSNLSEELMQSFIFILDENMEMRFR